MGTSQSRVGTDLSAEELEEYVETSFFTMGEIVELRQQYLEICNHESLERVPVDQMLEAKFLEHNPFKRRIVETFSTDEEQQLAMSFDDFVSMCTAFSSRAPKQLKIQAAFKIYDYNNDGFITKSDIRQILLDLHKTFGDSEAHWSNVPNTLTSEQIDQVAEKVMREVDVDNSGRITFYEFSKLLGKHRDFKMMFRFPGI